MSVTKINRNKDLLFVSGIILLGAILRTFYLGHQSLWLDEFFTYFLSSMDIKGFVDGVTQDVLPPLYYLLVRVALTAGRDEVVIRTVSMIFSVMTLPIVFKLARELFNRRVALISTFLLAISPLHVFYAQEARMHSMFSFFFGLSLITFWRAWQRNRFYDWLFFALSMAAAFYSHIVAPLYLLAIDVYCLIRLSELKQKWKGLLAVHIACLLAFLPWFVVMLGVIPEIQTEFAGSSLSILTPFTAPYLFLFGDSLVPVLVPAALFAGLALVAFALLSVSYALREQRAGVEGLILSLCIFLVPVIGLYLVSFIRPLFVIRRLLPASLGFLLLASWTVAEAKPRWLNLAAGTSVAVLMVASLSSYYFDPEVQKIPFRDIVPLIADEVGTDELLIHTSDTSAYATDYYAPELNSHFLYGDPDTVADTIRGRSQRIAGLAAEPLDSLIQDRDQFWLVVVLDHNLEYQAQIVEELDERFNRVGYKNIQGVELLQYRNGQLSTAN